MPQDVSINEIIDGMQLYEYWIGYFEDTIDKFCVFEDVADVFIKIDDDAFKTEQYKKGWMVKCVQYFIDYCGIAPIDIIEARIFPMERLGIKDWPKEDPIYSETGLFVHILMLEDEEFEYLLGKQRA